jgi:hypothetical protein
MFSLIRESQGETKQRKTTTKFTKMKGGLLRWQKGKGKKEGKSDSKRVIESGAMTHTCTLSYSGGRERRTDVPSQQTSWVWWCMPEISASWDYLGGIGRRMVV